MKSSIKFLAIIALFFTFNFAANAQRGGHSIDPEQMAEKQTTRMVEELNLNEAQTTKVSDINLTYAKKMQVAMKDNRGNRSAMKEIFTAIRTEKKAEVKLVLTDEQFKSYEEMEAPSKKEKRKRRGHRSK